MIALVSLVGALFLSPTYDRSDWISQSSWKKVRSKVLARDQTYNYWICRYSGTKLTNKRLVDIDHIVPLKYANEHCGDSFSETKKRQFATDTLNLVSTSTHENRSKGDDGVLEYMPSENQCWYLERWHLVTKKYYICLPSADSAYIARGVKACKSLK